MLVTLGVNNGKIKSVFHVCRVYFLKNINKYFLDRIDPFHFLCITLYNMR